MAHLKVLLGEWFMTCSICRTRKAWKHRNNLEKKSHKCQGYRKEEWQVTREKLKQALFWGFGMSSQAFERYWSATPTLEVEPEIPPPPPRPLSPRVPPVERCQCWSPGWSLPWCLAPVID